MVCCSDKTCFTTLVVCLTAILYTRLVAANNQTSNFSSPMFLDDHHLEDQFDRGALNESTTEIPEMQSLIRKESGKYGLPVACCPTIEEMIEPLGGRDRRGMYVELYHNDEYPQRFFEYSCRPDVLDKPCRFIDRELQAQSRCRQKYTYTFAIVQHQRKFGIFASFGWTSPWKLDYIRVRSGCSCELSPEP